MSDFTPMDIANFTPDQLKDWLNDARSDQVYALLRSLATEYRRARLESIALQRTHADVCLPVIEKDQP